jgi:hypothetical protein
MEKCKGQEQEWGGGECGEGQEKLLRLKFNKEIQSEGH